MSLIFSSGKPLSHSRGDNLCPFPHEINNTGNPYRYIHKSYDVIRIMRGFKHCDVDNTKRYCSQTCAKKAVYSKRTEMLFNKICHFFIFHSLSFKATSSAVRASIRRVWDSQKKMNEAIEASPNTQPAITIGRLPETVTYRIQNIEPGNNPAIDQPLRSRLSSFIRSFIDFIFIDSKSCVGSYSGSGVFPKVHAVFGIGFCTTCWYNCSKVGLPVNGLGSLGGKLELLMRKESVFDYQLTV